MDVPFHSSGAISRAHYAIVRKVETATSIQSADQYIFLEIKSLHEQLVHPKLSLGKCKECLLILLYCANTVTPGFLEKDAFEFAFLHAINLAEVGQRIEDKRIGYLFCSEMMPLDHELRLMLVNTLRKDLESDDVPRICLSLDNLIASPTEDVVPAVQSRLHDLLSHDYSCVKRRAILAFRALATHNPALLGRVHSVLLRRLKDADESVVKAALTVLGSSLPNDEATLLKTRNKLYEILATETSASNEINPSMVIHVLKCLQTIGITDTNIPRLLEIIQQYSNSTVSNVLSRAVLLETFRTLPGLKSGFWMSTEDSYKISAIQCIRDFLMSQKPNDVYLFISCLECVDVACWAGTTPQHPAVLEGREFERIMELLASPDHLTSKRALKVVNQIDPGILDVQIDLVLQSLSASNVMETVIVRRLLGIVFIRHEENGGKYASKVLELISHLEKLRTLPQVFKDVVEVVLTDIRISPTPAFLVDCAEHFIKVLLDLNRPFGPTSQIIGTALATEFSGKLSTPPQQLLAGLASRLRVCHAVVQEPCLLAMLRVRADCNVVPTEVLEIVNTIRQSARKVIQMRCDQFLQVMDKKYILQEIIAQAASSSLPDFLVALQNHPSLRGPPPPTTSTPQHSHASPRTSRPSSSLKYAAYEAPTATPRLRTRRMSGSQRSVSSSRSDTLSDPHHLSTSPPMTPGRLALAVGLQDLHIQEDLIMGKQESKKEHSEASRLDLMNFESPLPTDLFSALADQAEPEEDTGNFEDIWNAFNNMCDLRGWCKSSIDTIIRRLQRVDQHRLQVISADVRPFVGELKILIIPDETPTQPLQSGAIALRLRDSEEDSCLWRLRCSDVAVGARIQGVLDT